MRDLLRSWVWAAIVLAAALLVGGRMLSTAGTIHPASLILLLVLTGAATGAAAGLAHPAPARGSRTRYLRAVVPVAIVSGLLAGAAPALQGGGIIAATIAAVSMVTGAAAGAVIGATTVDPRPRAEVHWQPLGSRPSKRAVVSYGMASVRTERRSRDRR